MFKVSYKEQDKIRFQPNFKPWNLVIYQIIFIKRVMEQFSTLSFQPVWKHVKHIGLAKMFVWVSHKMLWKNPNEHFGQPNDYVCVRKWQILCCSEA